MLATSADRRRVLSRKLPLVGPPALALVLAAVTLLAGWRGVDQAAQVYRIVQFQRHGLQLWDSGWYSGNLPLGYSVAFPALAATVGYGTVVSASVVLATWSFDQLISTGLGRRPAGTWYFAAATMVDVGIGQWPFLAGEACGLAGLVCLQRGRVRPALILGLLSGLFSPLAAAFLAMAVLVWAVHSARPAPMVAVAAAALGLVGVLAVVFGGDGPFPDAWSTTVCAELLCLGLLSPLVTRTRVLRTGAVVYGLLVLLAFLIPDPVGGISSRLALSVGVPLVVCLAEDKVRTARTTRWRWSLAVAVAPFIIWQWSPVVDWTSPANGYTQAPYYRPLLDELHRLSPTPVRVEAVMTAQHWEAAYIAPQFPIARGWERQLDTLDNPIFYNHGLSPASYRSWLTANGVTYVALPSAPLDYSSVAEGRLLRAKRMTGLRLVWTNRDWELWQVTFSPGLVSGPAVLTSLGPGHLELDATAAGEITVRVRWSRFWSVTSGAACVSSSGPWTAVRALRPGTIDLSATLLGSPSAAGCQGS
jgi:hypothetical protein